MESSRPAWMEMMLDPSSYPHPVSEIELIQTHISWVFLAGDQVYKIKKPVDFGFLDFTTLEKRKRFCQEELRLNSRLCPEIYKDVLPITMEANAPVLNGSGPVVEWCLVMNRMPDAGMMQHLLHKYEIGKEEIDLIVDKLVPFYREADGGDEIASYGSLEVIGHNNIENFQQTTPFVGKLISQRIYEGIKSYCLDFMEQNRGGFNERIHGGWIKECHGDLYSANICFSDKRDSVFIFDCIEFNKRFRCGDVASDIAFLAMDLDFHGVSDLSAQLIRRYSLESHDTGIGSILNFYKCYRAYVRGKIGCFTWADPNVDDETKRNSAELAKRYFRLAGLYAGVIRPGRIYVFYGLSGTGKSTLATAFARKKGLDLFNSDRTRKEEIAGIPATERRVEGYSQGLYSRENTLKTYRALSAHAGRLAAQGKDVVLDATYTEPGQREALIETAQGLGTEPVFIHCVCDESEIKKRLSHRFSSQQGPSDGRWEIYLRQKQNYNHLLGTKGARVFEIDTSGSAKELLSRLETTLEQV